MLALRGVTRQLCTHPRLPSPPMTTGAQPAPLSAAQPPPVPPAKPSLPRTHSPPEPLTQRDLLPGKWSQRRDLRPSQYTHQVPVSHWSSHTHLRRGTGIFTSVGSAPRDVSGPMLGRLLSHVQLLCCTLERPGVRPSTGRGPHHTEPSRDLLFCLLHFPLQTVLKCGTWLWMQRAACSSPC